MKFEFDPNKSLSNQWKHGIDFVKAQALWKSPTIELHSHNPSEPRRLVIGKIPGQILDGDHHPQRGSDTDHQCQEIAR